MMGKKVYVASPVDPTLEVYRQIREEGYEVSFGRPPWVGDGKYTEDEILESCRDVDAVISSPRIPLSGKVLKSATKLSCISQAGVGVDKIDIRTASRLGILVANAPIEWDVMNVAEHTVAFILALAKKLKQIPIFLERGISLWDKRMDTIYLGKGSCIGIIGLGRIGSKVAELLRPFGVKLLGYDPYVPKDKAKRLDVKLVDLKTLLKESDFVTIHVPLTSETHHLIGARELALMKKTSYLINTSRGGVVDEAALIAALRDKKIAGAALDVVEDEPLKPSHPLFHFENVLLTPHIAGRSTESAKESARMAVKNCLKMLKGIVPESVVNPEAIPKWRERLGKG